jgi:hypothetical protein
MVISKKENFGYDAFRLLKTFPKRKIPFKEVL